MNKKVILISSSIVLVFILGIGIFLFMKKDNSGSSTLSNLLPFGLGGSDTKVGPVTPPNNQVTDTNTEVAPADTNGLRKISDGPVSGSVMLTEASTTLVRFMDRATGNIYEYNALTNAKKRLTNTTIPKAVRVAWGTKGDSFIAQTIKGDSISSYSGALASSTASSSPDSLREVTGEYLPDDIISLSYSPKRDSVFYLQKTYSGISGLLADKRGKNPKEVWKFPTQEWTSSWLVGDTVFLKTKSSSGLESYSYSLNTKTGSFIPTLSHIEGLSALPSPNGENILFSESKNSGTSLFLYSIKQKTTSPQPFTTLAEKCAWITNTKYVCGAQLSGISGKIPDDWYMGLVSFDDSLAIYDMNKPQSDESNEAVSVIEIQDTEGKGIDVINLQSNPDGNILSFQNKKDLSLWVLPIPKN